MTIWTWDIWLPILSKSAKVDFWIYGAKDIWLECGDDCRKRRLFWGQRKKKKCVLLSRPETYWPTCYLSVLTLSLFPYFFLWHQHTQKKQLRRLIIPTMSRTRAHPKLFGVRNILSQQFSRTRWHRWKSSPAAFEIIRFQHSVHARAYLCSTGVHV